MERKPGDWPKPLEAESCRPEGLVSSFVALEEPSTHTVSTSKAASFWFSVTLPLTKSERKDRARQDVIFFSGESS